MPHGDFNHIEIPADDTKRARAFYEGLFGWTFTETPFGDYMTYQTPAGEAGVEVVEENLDECVLCELCIKAAPPGKLRVLKLYDGSALEA